MPLLVKGLVRALIWHLYSAGSISYGWPSAAPAAWHATPLKEGFLWLCWRSLGRAVRRA